MFQRAVMCLTSCCPYRAGETMGLFQGRYSQLLTCCLIHRGGWMKSHAAQEIELIPLFSSVRAQGCESGRVCSPVPSPPTPGWAGQCWGSDTAIALAFDVPHQHFLNPNTLKNLIPENRKAPKAKAFALSSSPFSLDPSTPGKFTGTE